MYNIMLRNSLTKNLYKETSVRNEGDGVKDHGKGTRVRTK